MAVDQWTMAQAKRDFGSGYLTSFSIVRASMDEGWNVLLRAGTNRGPLVDARGGLARRFKTTDACVSALVQIGFKVEALCMI